MKTRIAIITMIIIILAGFIPVYADENYESVKAKVVENKGIQEVELENGNIQKEQLVEVRILEGEYEHEEHEMKYIISEDIEGTAVNVELKEKDIILIAIEEQDGEITSVSYKATNNQNYGLYAILGVLVILALVIARKNAIKPLIVFMLTICLVIGGVALALWQNWSIILIFSVISLFITTVISVKVNGIDKKTLTMIACSAVGTAISGILIYVLFDIMKLTNINIKFAGSCINIKELFVTSAILFGGVLSNIIVLSSLNMFTFLNKPYKRKSDNIIEGQRSLKL